MTQKNRAERGSKSLTDKLIWAFKEYIYMLNEELTELVPFAYTHGWKSSRYEQGVKMREKILKLEKELKSITKP